jgi:hypothetical protein
MIKSLWRAVLRDIANSKIFKKEFRKTAEYLGQNILSLDRLLRLGISWIWTNSANNYNTTSHVHVIEEICTYWLAHSKLLSFSYPFYDTNAAFH